MKITTPSFLGFGPKRVEFGIRQLLAVDAAADQRATQSEVFDSIFELRGGELRVLQGNRRQAGEPVRLRRANFGELLVLQLDDLVGEIGFGLVPKDRIGLSASMSMPCSSIALMRSGETTSPGVWTFNPIRALVSGKWQWACMSTVRTRFPPTTTSRRRCEGCENAGKARPHPIDATPVNAPAWQSNSLRVVVIWVSSFIYRDPPLTPGRCRTR